MIIDFNQFVEKICKRNNKSVDELTDKHWEKIRSLYKKETGIDVSQKKPANGTVKMSGYDAAVKNGATPDQVSEIVDVAAKKQFNEKKRIESEYRRNKEIEERKLSIKSISIPSPDAIRDQMAHHTGRLQTTVRNPLPIIDSEFGAALKLGPAQFIVFAAKAKGGKTTIASNICYSLHMANKKVLYLSNEELKLDILGRVAGLKLGQFYNNVVNSEVPPTILEQLCDEAAVVAQNITVLGNEDVNLNSVQGVVGVLEEYGDNYDVVILDYVSNVCEDLDNPAGTEWQAQEKVINYLNRFKNRTPVVGFTQIKGNAGKDDALAAKVEGRKRLQNVVTALIEVLPDKKAGITALKLDYMRWIEKDVWFFEFKSGRLKTISEEEAKIKAINAYADDISSKAEVENDTAK